MQHALVIIDMQVDFFNNPELDRCREDLVAACNLLVRRAREHGAPVIEVRTTHAEDRSTWALNMLEDGQGMTIAGSRGAEPVPGLEPADVVVEKTRDSAFHRTGLEDLLRDRDVGHVVLCGVSTESCIAATAADAYAHDLRATLVEDATASVDAGQHARTLEVLHEQYRQPVLPAREVGFARSGASSPVGHEAPLPG
jgi:nicotinamidase-related amidase